MRNATPIALVACLGGCILPSPGDSLRTATTVAAMRLDCPEASTHLTPFGSDTHVARGCGRQAMITCLPPGDFAGPTGECFPMQDLRTRAAFELACPGPTAIALEPLDATGRDVGARGCGRRAVYQYVQVDDDHYDWVLSGALHARSRAARESLDEDGP